MRELQQMDMKSVVALFISVAGNYSVMFLLHLKTLCEDAARALFR